MNPAFTKGQLEAGAQFGLQKESYARLLGTAIGAGLGALAAPEGEGVQGAVLGGLGGYGAGALASRGMNALRGAPPHFPAASSPVASIPPTSSSPSPLAPAPSSSVVMSIPPIDPYAAGGAVSVGTPVMHPRLQGVQKAASEFGLSMQIPKTPFGVGISEKDAILPGMHRWVPREVIERTHRDLDSGLDDQAILESEMDRGRFSNPLLGAAAGAALAHYGLPNGGPAGLALGALLGGGLGATYHGATADTRRLNAVEALHGVHRQRAIEGQDRSTAREPVPLVVSRGEGGKV